MHAELGRDVAHAGGVEALAAEDPRGGLEDAVAGESARDAPGAGGGQGRLRKFEPLFKSYADRARRVIRDTTQHCSDPR